MPMYNLIEYSDNYSDPKGSLWQFKRVLPVDNANFTVNNGVFNSELFKYEAALVGRIANAVGEKSFVKIHRNNRSIKVSV